MKTLQMVGAMFATVLVSMLVASAAATAVYAQEPSTTINLGELMAPWLEMVIGAVAILITAILGWIAAQVKAKTGIDIEARHREALQTALTNAAGLVLNKLGDKATDVEFDVRHPLVREGITYLNRAAPDAIANFGLTPEQLAEKIVAKLGLATAPSNIQEPSTGST